MHHYTEVAANGAPKPFIPIYPNRRPTVPKPSRGGRTASLVFIDLPASQGATTRLLNRCRGQNSYRGFESPLSATAKVISKHAAICALLLLLSAIALFVFIVLQNPKTLSFHLD